MSALRVRALNILLITVAIAVAPRVWRSIVEVVRDPAWWPQTIPFLVAYLFLVVLAVFRRLDFRLRAWGLIVVGYGFAALSLAMFGLASSGPFTLLALPMMGILLIGIRPGLVMTGLSLLVYAVFALTAHLGWLENWLILKDNPVALQDWLGVGVVFMGLLLMLVTMQIFFGQAQIHTLQKAHQTAADLAKARDQVQAHAEALDRYARQLEATAHIAREITSLLEQQVLLQRAADLIAGQLQFERVAIYVPQEPGAEIALGAIGGAGAKAEATAAVPSAVAQAAQTGIAHTDMTTDDEGATCCRVILPLQVGERIVGVLDVRAARPIPPSEEEAAALQVMADQLAIALENAHLFAETQASLRELDALYRHYTAEAWERFGGEGAKPVHCWPDAAGMSGAEWQSLFVQARTSGQTVTRFDQETDRHLLAVPVRLRGLPIGVLGFHRPGEAGPWDQEQIGAIEAVADRLALAADNLRLLESAQRRAARERLLAQVTEQMRASLDIETVLRTAVREMQSALGMTRVEVLLEEPVLRDNGGNHDNED